MEAHITALLEPWWGIRACDHIAGGLNNPGLYPGMRASAAVRGAVRPARERRKAPAHVHQKSERTACRSGYARPAALSPATSLRTTG